MSFQEDIQEFTKLVIHVSVCVITSLLFNANSKVKQHLLAKRWSIAASRQSFCINVTQKFKATQ
jgi:hypothetical protein